MKNVAQRETVSAEQVKSVVLESGIEPGKVGIAPIPAFLVPMVEQAALELGQQYFPILAQLTKDAVAKGIDAIASKFHLSPK